MPIDCKSLLKAAGATIVGSCVATIITLGIIDNDIVNLDPDDESHRIAAGVILGAWSLICGVMANKHFKPFQASNPQRFFAGSASPDVAIEMEENFLSSSLAL